MLQNIDSVIYYKIESFTNKLQFNRKYYQRIYSMMISFMCKKLIRENNSLKNYEA